MNIRQIASNDALTGLILSRMLPYSPLLDRYVEFYIGAGDATSQRKEDAGVAASSRALDSNYTGQNLKPTYFPTGRKLMGEKVSVDVARELMGFDIPSEFAAQLSRLAPGLAAKFDNTLINGNATGTPTEFNGLKVLCPNAQIIVAATNGLVVVTGSDNAAKSAQQLFLEKLDETIAACKGINKVLLVNSITHSRINSIAREYLQYTETSFGKKIMIYNGTPIVDIEANGATILPFTETVGTATTTCSMYCVSFEERAGLSFFTTPSGLKVYPLKQVDNFWNSMVDFILDSSLFRDKAISRLTGLKFS